MAITSLVSFLKNQKILTWSSIHKVADMIIGKNIEKRFIVEICIEAAIEAFKLNGTQDVDFYLKIIEENLTTSSFPLKWELRTLKALQEYFQGIS